VSGRPHPYRFTSSSWGAQVGQSYGGLPRLASNLAQWVRIRSCLRLSRLSRSAQVPFRRKIRGYKPKFGLLDELRSPASPSPTATLTFSLVVCSLFRVRVSLLAHKALHHDRVKTSSSPDLV
jgi:hypothetical protein